MRILITGAEGQIGRALVGSVPTGVDTVALGRSQLDITREAEVLRGVRSLRPDLVVNAAGYTAVDRAETEPDAAQAVNAEGARWLARAAAEVGARLVHFSTDYVFDGSQARPYLPGDLPRPLNVYGASKLAGERAVLETLGRRAVVLRTAWIYSAHGRNFLLTMLRLLKEKERIQVVSDQVGTPTTASSVAAATWAIVGKLEVQGIVHWTEDGVASWYDFAVAIREEGMAGGLLMRPAEVAGVGSSEYPTPACRPRYSVLDCSEARAALGLDPDHWRVALRRTMRELVSG
jgi:dTDP-4-dehydrorhamnose reductase